MQTQTKHVLIGSEFTLTRDALTIWPDEVPVNATMSITINGIDGAGLKKADNEIYLIMGSSIAAPAGVCIDYTWMESTVCDAADKSGTCEKTAISTLTGAMKLAVLDDKGCPTAHVTLDQIMTYVTANIEFPQLCDMVTSRPNATTADMRVLVLQNGCDLASVPVSAFDCIMSDPENFSCE